MEIENGIYWVGANDQITGLHCNPYLIVDGDEAILIEPGSPIDFEIVRHKVEAIIPLSKIKYVILSHQDPDLCASVPLFEKLGLDFEIVCHWRASVIIKYYGVTSKFYLTNEHEGKLTLKSGREIKFLNAPYLHFPGAILTYDTKTKILFSGDLFGGFSNNWEPYAREDYIEAMKLFHENYMPSNDIIRPVMELLLNMDISKICPQHGSIIINDIKKHIKVLRDLECGTYLNPIKRELTKTGGYTGICNQILKRFYSVFNRDEVKDVFKGTDIVLNGETYLIEDFNCTGKELWNKIFELILTRKGLGWISVVETMVAKIVKEYDIDYPEVYKGNLLKVEQEIEKLNEENKTLKELNGRLKNNLKETENKLIKCPITNLYNEDFCHNYMKKEFETILENKLKIGIMVIEIDNIAKINFNYGNSEGDETLKKISYIILQNKWDNHLLFKLKGPSFLYYVPLTEKDELINLAEKIRNAVNESSIFIEKMTVSIGIVKSQEIDAEVSSSDYYFNKILNIAKLRVRIAKNRGMDIICDYSDIEEYKEDIGKILIVDNDEINLDVLETTLKQLKFNVITSKDGVDALDKIEKELPDLVVSEVMLPKMDGFMLREKMRNSSVMKNIPFILLSFQKDEEAVERAISLDVDYFLKKPYMLSELVGIIKNKTKGEKIREYNS